jgi:hypothetical protein
MDDLGSHESAAIRQAINAAGARLWLRAPYSPDLNPIEQAFSKIKHRMRKAQKRTIDDTWRNIGGLAKTIQLDEYANYPVSQKIGIEQTTLGFLRELDVELEVCCAIDRLLREPPRGNMLATPGRNAPNLICRAIEFLLGSICDGEGIGHGKHRNATVVLHLIVRFPPNTFNRRAWH